jgi:anaerobic selenocysteine-containing dehydrogenase
VSIDLYVNETSRHADLILPTTFGLEDAHYSVLFLGLAVRNVAHYSPAILEKPAGLRHDWEILLALAEQLEVARGGLEAVKGRLRGAFGRALGPKRILDLFLRFGPHRLSVAKLERAPHGLDLGPLQPRLASLMRRRKVKVAPPRFVADLPRLEARLVCATNDLVLVSRRTLRSNNSWGHNSERLVSGKNRCTLQIHPEDAARCGVASGQRVALKSRVGEIVVPAEVTDTVMRGVVSLPHGWGHDRAGVQLRIASSKPGASVNDITDESFVDALSGTSSFSGVPVSITSIDAAIDAGIAASR